MVSKLFVTSMLLSAANNTAGNNKAAAIRFISILPLERTVARRRDRNPAMRLSPLGALGEPGEERQHDEILNGQNESANQARHRGGQPQIGLPQAAKAGAPEPLPRARRRKPPPFRPST